MQDLHIQCRENLYLILAQSWGHAKIMFALGNSVQLTTVWKSVSHPLSAGRSAAVIVLLTSRLATQRFLPFSGICLLKPHYVYFSIRNCVSVTLIRAWPRILLLQHNGIPPATQCTLRGETVWSLEGANVATCDKERVNAALNCGGGLLSHGGL